MTDTMELNNIASKGSNEPVITSLILKGTSGSTNDRDAGFCSGGDEDDLEIEDEIHSPTDVSEDSVDVKVIPISSRNKNKRKCAEPRKVPNEEAPTGPLKKRIRFEMKQEAESGRQSPFRPWNAAPASVVQASPQHYHPVYGYQPPQAIAQEEPLSLVKDKQQQEALVVPDPHLKLKSFPKASVEPRVPPHPAVSAGSSHEVDELAKVPKVSPGFSVDALLSPKTQPSSSQRHNQKEPKEQRNYKNMTRERRIEANARERTRVHTISAAFDTLRRAIPAYSNNQKLSKLSVLRIACSYILTLSRVAGRDYSADQSAPSLSSCVDLVSRTIQTEGKLRKKKEE